MRDQKVREGNNGDVSYVCERVEKKKKEREEKEMKVTTARGKKKIITFGFKVTSSQSNHRWLSERHHLLYDTHTHKHSHLNQACAL